MPTTSRRPNTHFELTAQPAEPQNFLTANEAASFLRVAAVTLSRWRLQGQGPPFRKFGRRVLYARTDLSAWAEAQKRQSTSETGTQCRTVRS